MILYTTWTRSLWHRDTPAGTKCAREALLKVDEGGRQYDITHRRKARVSLAEWAHVAVALMVLTSDGNATAAVVCGASIRSIRQIHRLLLLR